ncbi:hypothetical protein M427DRAFT_72028 [Gonapodya prolifera JEL478]|uniref:Uncharacterized protein n=1 Tax=Gonapodya prolifera (strain JEL478) TaxID=1344416 RepID=A0A139A6P8_GONPJ|nr:hypothetical protein M427DRAFT_72028 [Gonapodya prolifera JEL478]|eukprot:KXS12374.1 hypothetical protein M427DRAFT_72028 [Gonapodya prolifera JEL478]
MRHQHFLPPQPPPTMALTPRQRSAMFASLVVACAGIAVFTVAAPAVAPSKATVKERERIVRMEQERARAREGR